MMTSLLLTLVLAADTLQGGAAVTRVDSMQTDTLREVTVRPLKELPPVQFSLQGKIDLGIKSPPSLLNILEKRFPGIQDKIMHPTAFKARRREKRRKRCLKTLEDYDKVKTFGELLQEAYEQQMKENAQVNR